MAGKSYREGITLVLAPLGPNAGNAPGEDGDHRAEAVPVKQAPHRQFGLLKNVEPPVRDVVRVNLLAPRHCGSKCQEAGDG